MLICRWSAAAHGLEGAHLFGVGPRFHLVSAQHPGTTVLFIQAPSSRLMTSQMICSPEHFQDPCGGLPITIAYYKNAFVGNQADLFLAVVPVHRLSVPTSPP